MSWYDSQLVLDTGTTPRTASGNVAGENYIDLSAALRDLGAGKQVFLNVSIIDSFYSTTENSTTALELVALPYQPPTPTTFAGLTATVTATNATDLINWTAHGLQVGTPVYFSVVTTSGITQNRVYYVTNPTTNAFQLATSLSLALKGTANTGIITADGAAMTAVAIPQVLATTGPLSVQGALTGVVNQGLLPFGTQLSVPLMPPLQWSLLGGAGNASVMGLVPRPVFRWGCLRVVNSAAMSAGRVRAWLSHESVGSRRYFPSGFTA